MTEQAITEQALQQDVVLFEEIACVGGKIIGIATLNSEKSLNALSLPMVELLLPQMQQWKNDNNIALGVPETKPSAPVGISAICIRR
jgi:enoyl-CoA hydratase/carnithine racemase